jgi:hypothetical protein
MIQRRVPIRMLRIAIVPVAVFNILALLVMVHTTPVAFTLFMFLGQPLFLVAFLLLIGAVLADLKARQIV